MCYHYPMQAHCCHYYTHAYLSMQCLEVSADYYPDPPGIVSPFNAYNYIYTGMALHIDTQGRFNDHTSCSLYRIHGHSNQCCGHDEIGNIVPRVGIELTSLPF